MVNGSYVTPLGENGTLTKNADGSYVYVDKFGMKENYDQYGRLISIVATTGNSLVFTYEGLVRDPLIGVLPFNLDMSLPLTVAFDYRLTKIEEMNVQGNSTGNWVALHYDSTTGRLSDLADSTGRTITYGHDSIGNLTNVSGTGINARYDYNDALHNHIITDINEGYIIYTNYYDNNGRVIKQEHGNGTITFEYLLPFQKTRMTTVVKDNTGNVLNTGTRTVEFDNNGQVIKVTDSDGNVINFTRNANTWITREEFWENGGSSPKAAWDYTYDNKGNLLSLTEASGTPLEKTTYYTYHPTFNKVLTRTVQSVVDPSQEKVTAYTYDDATSNVLSRIESGLLNSNATYTYVTSYSYDQNGKIMTVDGPRTDVNDITTYTHDNVTGYLTAITRPLVGTTTFSNFDTLGNPQTVTDPNGNSTSLTFDNLGRVTSVKAPGDTAATSIYYVNAGCTSCSGVSNVDYITFPSGYTVHYSFDNLGHLIKISDSSGSINFTYDSDGNRLTETIQDASGASQQSLSYAYDFYDRLTRVINPDAASSFTGFGYDSLGRRNSIKDPMGNITAFQYDELSRVSTVTQPGDITTILGYTVNNRLQTEADANRNTTTYLYDDMGRVYQVSSPDTGTTVYRYDPAGNMVSKKDAKGTTLTYQYDALNRLTKIYFPTDAGTAYTYDSCVNGKGRLCSMSDVAGTTNYEYTPKGQIQKETKILDGYTYITKYAYDPDGNISTIIYPSGKTITYTYLNGRVVAVLKDNTTLASNITYKPFGGMTSITYANGLTGTIGYDNQYRITSIITGAVLNLSYTGFDYNGNVTTIKNNLDTTKNRSFGYDALNRLTSANGFWGGIGWLYDGVGNRTIQTDSGGTSSYSYLAGTNKISGIMGANSSTFTFDADGNTYSENTRVYTYNENQRLIKVTDGGITTGQYMYNANGQRVKKVASGVATYFLYGPGGRLIAESNSAGTITTEYIYLNGQLFGKMEGTNIYYYHNDHLGTPQKMTDSFGTVVWAADYKPFGETTVIVSTITNNLRFPGQYYDTETGLNYNYRRDYNSILGLYIEADPLWLPFFYQGKNYFLVPYYTKLPSRLHEYVYAENSPVMNSDPRGLMGAKGGSAKDKDAGNSTGNQCMTKLQQRINNGSCPNWTDCFTCCNDLMPDIFGTEAIVVCTEACDAGLKIAKKKSCKCSDSSL